MSGPERFFLVEDAAPETRRSIRRRLDPETRGDAGNALAVFQSSRAGAQGDGWRTRLEFCGARRADCKNYSVRFERRISAVHEDLENVSLPGLPPWRFETDGE